MLVVVYHFWPAADITSAWLKLTVGRGYLWVDLFFVLSGYVIALNYGASFARGFSVPVFAGFLIRRVARIYPLYIILLTAQICYTVVMYGGFDRPDAWATVTSSHPAVDIPANVLLVQSLAISPSFINQAWSISTEFGAYFCFPIFVVLVMVGSWRAITMTAVLASVLLGTAAAIVMHDGAYHSGLLDAYDGTQIAPAMRCLGGFLLGMLTFRLDSVQRLARFAARDSVGVLTLIALIAAMSAGASDLVIVAMFPVVVICLSRNLGLPAAIFANPVTYCLGVWSYAVYLLHPLLQKPRDVMNAILNAWLPHGLSETLASLAIIAALLLLSWASYNGIEAPGRRAIQRLAAGLTVGGEARSRTML
jgi:peptidoglycan/LPS O-acetylase OafA/YrhL